MRTVALLLLLVAPQLLANDRTLARDYLRARCSTLVKGATEADVDRVLHFLDDDVVVEHPAFNAVVRGKEAVGRGMTSHLPEYTGGREESGIVLLSTVEAPGAIVMKTRTTFVIGEGDARKVIAREGLTVVEIQDGYIVRLIEY